MSVQIPEFLRLNVQNDGVSSESYESCESHREIELAEMEAAVQEYQPDPNLRGPKTDPYLKQDFDGRTLYVSSIMATAEEVDDLIALLTAFRPLMPDDRKPMITREAG